MRRRHKYEVKAIANLIGFNHHVNLTIGETWANNENQAINNLKHRLIFNPETMIYICYTAKEVL